MLNAIIFQEAIKLPSFSFKCARGDPLPLNNCVIALTAQHLRAERPYDFRISDLNIYGSLILVLSVTDLLNIHNPSGRRRCKLFYPRAMRFVLSFIFLVGQRIFCFSNNYAIEFKNSRDCTRDGLGECRPKKMFYR